MLPKYLLDQISIRAHIAARSRNEEMRALVAAGLDEAGERDFVLEFPEGVPVRGIVWIEDETILQVGDRARSYGRSMGKELVRLMGYAIQRNVDRDLAMLAAAMSRQVAL